MTGEIPFSSKNPVMAGVPAETLIRVMVTVELNVAEVLLGITPGPFGLLTVAR
jgi:hypothetical protein